MDFVGVTRTIDHAVYMLLNSLAIVLWRLNTALIGISLFSYNTQDWLTGADGGVWRVMAKLVGADGIFGLATWQAFLLLALTLFGFSRVVRPFLRVQPVDPGRLLLFGILAYIVITQGQALMQAVESWRAEAGSYMYAELATGETVALDIPGSAANASTEPLAAPQDLDGQVPIRGWEAVASSYFLVQQAGELHAGLPARDFRVAYCLYDPNKPIDDQAEENSAGCSPRKAWDEWDRITVTPTITQVWGIPLPSSFSLDLPLVQEHPDHRQLAIRQAQAGVARLALGPIVALFPLVEANIALMLALAASFIYLSLPISLIFGFFLYTESMATRLLLQLINVIIRTLILNGLVAVFLMLLMSVSLNGSLTTYLGLVGVGLAGGFLLMRFAAGTMKETFSQALGAVGGVWLGAAAATFGSGAARPARAALGLAKLGATAAVLGAARGRSLDLAEAGLHSARSGVSDLQQASPATMNQVQRAAGRLPAPLARLARAELATAPGGRDPEGLKAAVPMPGTLLSSPLLAGTGATDKRGERAGQETPAIARATHSFEPDYQMKDTATYRPTQRQATGQVGQPVGAEPPAGRLRQPDDRLTAAAVQISHDHLAEETGRVFGNESGRRDPAARVTPQPHLPRTHDTGHVASARQRAVDDWVSQTYQARDRQPGQPPARELGQTLLGEDLAREAERALGRHRPAETRAVLDAARQAQAQRGQPLIGAEGQFKGEAAQAIRRRLDDQTAQAFDSPQGRRDLLTLSAVALQEDRTARPDAFRQAMAEARGTPDEPAPGRTVPRALGLDPVAAGAHFGSLNRFARLSEQAGLTPQQRHQLLAEVRQGGALSAGLRTELETALRRQPGGGVKLEELVAGAAALPETLSGPRRIQLPDRPVAGTKPAPDNPGVKRSATTRRPGGHRQTTAPEKQSRVPSSPAHPQAGPHQAPSEENAGAQP